MRIGIDVRLWNESGVGRYIRNLVGNLARLDHKNEYVLFCLSKDSQEILCYAQNDNFRTVIANIRWHTIEEQLRFPSVLKKEKLDLVHFPYFSVPFFYQDKFVVTIHDLIINHFDTGEASTLPSYFYKVKRIGYQSVIKQAIQKSQKIITVSNSTKQEIIDHYHVDTNKIVVTYEGVDSGIQNSELRIKNENSNDKKNYFLYVGNAYPHKNLNRLIEAFKIVKDKNNSLELKLILVGKEDYFYKRLRKKVTEMHLEKNIIFRGFVANEELSSLYKNAVALVAPSLMEGFGLPVLEAMSNTCLVLASDIPVFHEIAGDAAQYFNPSDASSIAEVLMRVLKKDDRIKAQKKKGLLLVKKFSWKTLAEKTLEIYESCHSLRPG